MTLAKSLEKVASKVIAKFGGDVTIRYVTAGSYNTTTGGIAERLPVTPTSRVFLRM
jgi:hypothetical protein